MTAKKTQATPARVEFLQRAAMRDRGTYAVDYYPPLKWALTRGYVERTGIGPGREHRYRITDAGRAWLAEVSARLAVCIAGRNRRRR